MGCAVVGAIFLVLAGLLVAWVRPMAPERIPRLQLPEQVPFDPAVWREGTDVQRLAMIQDVYESKVLLGKSRPELETLLGPPSAVGFGTLTWNATATPQRSGGSDRGWPGITVWIENGGTAYEMGGGRSR